MNAPLDPAALSRVSLEDKYTLERGRVFLTGLQAIARLAMLQRVRDLRAGLNTAGYISGYRGSRLAEWTKRCCVRVRTWKSITSSFSPG